MQQEPTQTRTVRQQRVRQPNTDLLGAAVLIAISTVSLLAMGDGVRNWLFPRMLTYTMMAGAILLVILGVRRMHREATPEGSSGADAGSKKDVSIFATATIGYVLLLPWLGFWITSFAMVFGGSVYLTNTKTTRTLIVSVVVALSICITAYFLFLRVFYVSLPTGELIPEILKP